MSENICELGKFWPVKVTEEEAEKICKALGFTDEDLECYENWMECLIMDAGGYAVIKPLGLCRVESRVVDSLSEVTKNADDTYSFCALYYNGSESLSGMLEDGLEQLSDEEENG